MSLKTTLYRLKRQRLVQKKHEEELLSDQEVTELWHQCKNCKTMVFHTDLEKNMMVCPECDQHSRISAYQRVEHLVDAGTWQELNTEVTTADPLEFSDLKSYKKRVESARRSSESSEAIITGVGDINGQKAALALMEFSFLGGSMGSVVGERIARITEHAIENNLPLIISSSSGGARMHEGLVSLFQMAKTSAVLAKLKEKNLLFISLLTDPTYGGVSASYSMLGDIIIAEPKAKIGFAGPRVIEETIRQKLPKDFQTAEYLLENGQIDLVIHRHELKNKISTLLRMHKQK